MTSLITQQFKTDFQKHQQPLKLKGLRPKTIDAYTRAMARIGQYFEYQVYDLSQHQLIDYFDKLLKTPANLGQT